jgi:hypothetical protein
MNMKLVAAVTILTAFASMPALAEQPAAPKASKADVQKVISGIKADKAKLAAYCASAKLDDEASAVAAKDQKDPKLQGIGEKIDELNKKVGPDFEKVINSELDEESAALLGDLTKSCQ